MIQLQQLRMHGVVHAHSKRNKGLMEDVSACDEVNSERDRERGRGRESQQEKKKEEEKEDVPAKKKNESLILIYFSLSKYSLLPFTKTFCNISNYALYNNAFIT